MTGIGTDGTDLGMVGTHVLGITTTVGVTIPGIITAGATVGDTTTGITTGLGMVADVLTEVIITEADLPTTTTEAAA